MKNYVNIIRTQRLKEKIDRKGEVSAQNGWTRESAEILKKKDLAIRICDQNQGSALENYMAKPHRSCNSMESRSKPNIELFVSKVDAKKIKTDLLSPSRLHTTKANESSKSTGKGIRLFNTKTEPNTSSANRGLKFPMHSEQELMAS